LPPRVRRTQAERRADARERLHRALAELICEQGYVPTTASQIGERAGFSRNMVRDSFGSKLDLFVDYAAVAYPSPEPPLPPTATGLERTLETVERVIRLARAEPVVLQASYMVMFEMVAGEDVLARLVRGGHVPYAERRAEALADGIADGSIRPEIDPPAEAELLRAEGMGIAYAEMLGLGDRPLVERLQLWRDDVHERLATRASASPSGPPA
jgi:AcrR family transcriptional regulator